MKQHALTLLLATSLAACGGASSTTGSQPKSEKLLRLDTRTFDYTAIKDKDSWSQLTEKSVQILKAQNSIIELATLCIEHDTTPHSYRFYHHVIDLSSYQDNTPLDPKFACTTPKNASTVNITNGTADFNLVDAEADNIRNYSSSGDPSSFRVPSHRTQFDLIAIGKNATTNKYFGHRNQNLTLKDSETYSIDFNNTSSAELIAFTPKKSDGFKYELDFITNNGISMDMPKTNETWHIIPDSLKNLQNKDGYQEEWGFEKDGNSIGYLKQSQQPGASNRLTLETAKLPTALLNWSVDKTATNNLMPSIPAKFDNYKVHTIQARLDSTDNRTEYGYISIGSSINKETNLKIIDFSRLPNFNGLAPTFSLSNLGSVYGNIAQYESLTNAIDVEGDAVFYSFKGKVN